MRWIERLAGVADLATVTGLQICCRPVLCIRALPVDAAPRLLLLELSFILVLLLALLLVVPLLLLVHFLVVSLVGKLGVIKLVVQV